MKKLPFREQIKQRSETESPIESILLREFHLMDFYPEIQFKFGKYRLDLAFPKYRIAIECDGKAWHSTEEQIARDKERDQYLEDYGWKVMRVTGSDIFRRADEIVKQMLATPISKNRTLLSEVSIDYENDLPEIIEEKEKAIKEMVDDAQDYGLHPFSSMKEVMGNRYKYSV